MAQVGRSRPARGSVAGPPGTGKTTFLKALLKVAQRMGVRVIYIQAKDCNQGQGKLEVRNAAHLVAKRISSILQFTVSDGFRPAFDALSTSECSDIKCLMEFANKKFRADVVSWIEPRLKMLTRFIHNDAVVIPTCITEEDDELVRRLVVGLLYVLRQRIAVPIIFDDMLSFITNEPYSKAFGAMMRPYLLSVNKDLESSEVLMYNPVIIVPGGHAGFYRLAHPHKYTIIFDAERWVISRGDIEKIAYS